MVSDDVCIESDLCAESFSFFSMESQTGLEPSISGILGFSPNAKDNGPSFISALFDQKIISKPKLSF